MGWYRIAHVRSVPPRPKQRECRGTHLSLTFVVHYMRQPSRPYTCTSYYTFRNSFGRTAKFKIWPIRHWGEKAHSNRYHMILVANTQDRKGYCYRSKLGVVVFHVLYRHTTECVVCRRTCNGQTVRLKVGFEPSRSSTSVAGLCFA